MAAAFRPLCAVQIRLIICYQVWDIFPSENPDQTVFLLPFPGRRIDYQNRNVCFIQYLTAFSDSLFPQLSFIVNTRRINNHDRSQRQELHGFTDRIRCRTLNLGNNRQLLTRHCIDKT